MRTPPGTVTPLQQPKRRRQQRQRCVRRDLYSGTADLCHHCRRWRRWRKTLLNIRANQHCSNLRFAHDGQIAPLTINLTRPQIGGARDFRSDRAGASSAATSRFVFIPAPTPPPLRARKNHHLARDAASTTSANFSTCPSAKPRRPTKPARRSSGRR